jgi:hypothetical protein
VCADKETRAIMKAGGEAIVRDQDPSAEGYHYLPKQELQDAGAALLQFAGGTTSSTASARIQEVALLRLDSRLGNITTFRLLCFCHHSWSPCYDARTLL